MRRTRLAIMASSNKAPAAAGGGAYFLAFIGALVWNLQVASDFWGYVWGVIESFFWPAFLVWELFALAAS
jgi:hypothetical protein